MGRQIDITESISRNDSSKAGGKVVEGHLLAVPLAKTPSSLNSSSEPEEGDISFMRNVAVIGSELVQGGNVPSAAVSAAFISNNTNPDITHQLMSDSYSGTEQNSSQFPSTFSAMMD